jgi:hypothetical protein
MFKVVSFFEVRSATEIEEELNRLHDEGYRLHSVIGRYGLMVLRQPTGLTEFWVVAAARSGVDSSPALVKAVQDRIFFSRADAEQEQASLDPGIFSVFRWLGYPADPAQQEGKEGSAKEENR